MTAANPQALILIIALSAGANALAQDGQQDRPAPVPPARPATAVEKDQQTAKRLFLQASVLQRRDQHLETIRMLEECGRFDPDAAPPHKLLAKVYRLVGRTGEAATAARKVTELRPDESDGWKCYADLLRENRRTKEAADALEKASRCADIAQHPTQLFQALNLLAGWREKLSDFESVVNVGARMVALLDKNREAFEQSGFLSAAEFAAEKAGAHERIGRAELMRKNFAAAHAAFGEAARCLGGRDDAATAARTQRLHLYIAQVEHELGRDTRALEHLDQYLQTKPKEIEPYRLWVTLHDKLNQQREKLRGLEDFAKRDKTNIPLQLLRAEQYAAAGDFKEAENGFLAAARNHPKADAYKGLFRFYERDQRMDLGLRKLDEYLAVADDKSKNEEARAAANRHVQAIYTVLRDHPAMIRELLPLAQGEWVKQVREKQNFNYRTMEVLAGLAARSGELEAAEQLFRESLGRAGSRFQEASLNEGLILVLLAQRKYPDAIAVCERGLGGDDNKFMYEYYRAFPLAQLGRTDDAFRAIEQAALDAHSDGTKMSARLRKIDILSWIGSHARAIEECEALLKEFGRPDQVRLIRLKLASVHSAAREHAKAERQLRILLERDPNDARVCNDLGYQLADQNRNLNEAERLIRRALALDRAEQKRGDDDDDDTIAGEQENAAYIDSLGWVLFRRGMTAEARRLLEKAVALPDGREDPNIWDHLGDVLSRSGDAAGARIAWQSARKYYFEERRTKKDGRLDEVERKLKLP